MFTVADPTGSVANNLASVRSSASETLAGNWTSVAAVQVEEFSSNIREFEETTAQEPLFEILGSSLAGESGSASLEITEFAPASDSEINETADVRLENPLTANLVDLAMIQLSLNAVHVV